MVLIALINIVFQRIFNLYFLFDSENRPSMVVQWFPEKDISGSDHYSKQRLLLVVMFISFVFDHFDEYTTIVLC